MALVYGFLALIEDDGKRMLLRGALPIFGITRTAIVVGLLNVAVAWLTILLLRRYYHAGLWVRVAAGEAAVVLVVAFVFSWHLVRFFESLLYRDEVVYTAQTPYQAFSSNAA